jgi:hypothetical protein
MVLGLHETKYELRLKELGLVTLEERHHQVDMQMIRKIIYANNGLRCSRACGLSVPVRWRTTHEVEQTQ